MTAELGIAQSVQLALTPVFLLTAVGSMLNVVAQRLARVVDRARAIEAALPAATGEDRGDALAELASLERRMALANRAVVLCVGSALVACLLIAALFLSESTALPAARLLPPLFLIVLSLLVAGLGAFLAEVRIATRTVRFRVQQDKNRG